MHDGLQQAIRDHAEWHRRIVRTLVCRLEVDPRTCARTRSAPALRALASRPGAAGVEGTATVRSGRVRHRRLHESAAEVLVELTDHASVSAATFDRFVEHSVRLRVDLDSLRTTW